MRTVGVPAPGFQGGDPQGYSSMPQTVQYEVAAPTIRTKKKEPPVHIGKAAEAKDRVHYMHRQMQEVEETISNLQAEKRLKMKLLNDRRATLEKYFMVDDHLLKQGVMGEWKRIMEMLRRMREVDGMESMRAGDRSAYEQRIAELEQVLAESNAEVVQSETEKGELKDGLNQAEHLIRTVGEGMTLYPMPANPPRIPAPECESYMKRQIHQLLKDMDSMQQAETNTQRVVQSVAYVTPRTAQGGMVAPGPGAGMVSMGGAMGGSMGGAYGMLPPQQTFQQTIMQPQTQTYATYG